MAVGRSLFLLLILLIALPLVAYGQMNQGGGGDTIDVSDLQLYEVRPDTVALTVNAIGAIEPAQSVDLSLLTGGRVQDVFVVSDAYVLVGDDLLTLENDVQRIAYEQASIGVTQAELAYEDLITTDETQIALAQANVDASRGQFLSTVSVATQGDLEAADLQYEQALTLSEQLRVERSIAGSEFGFESIQYDQADAAYGQSTFEAEIARLRAEQLRNGAGLQAFAASLNIDVAEAELNRVVAGPTQAQLDTASTNIEAAENILTQAETAFARTILTAPFSGVITQLNTSVGSLVAPGIAVIELMDVSSLGLTVQVDEIDIGLVEVGQAVRVTLDALPDVAIPATVTAIAPLGTPSGGIVSYDVDIALDGSDPRVRVGMTAEATVIINEIENVLAVPNIYVRRDRNTGETFVNVLRDDNTLEEVAITIGIQGRDTSEVLSGLDDGDLVALDLSGNTLDLFGGQ
ncbi:MAG: efflux RND transporter periplasmic adaptor subunit [Chloroflexota bacterium]